MYDSTERLKILGEQLKSLNQQAAKLRAKHAEFVDQTSHLLSELHDVQFKLRIGEQEALELLRGEEHDGTLPK